MKSEIGNFWWEVTADQEQDRAGDGNFVENAIMRVVPDVKSVRVTASETVMDFEDKQMKWEHSMDAFELLERLLDGDCAEEKEKTLVYMFDNKFKPTLPAWVDDKRQGHG